MKMYYPEKHSVGSAKTGVGRKAVQDITTKTNIFVTSKE